MWIPRRPQFLRPEVQPLWENLMIRTESAGAVHTVNIERAYASHRECLPYAPPKSAMFNIVKEYYYPPFPRWTVDGVPVHPLREYRDECWWWANIIGSMAGVYTVVGECDDRTFLWIRDNRSYRRREFQIPIIYDPIYLGV